MLETKTEYVAAWQAVPEPPAGCTQELMLCAMPIDEQPLPQMTANGILMVCLCEPVEGDEITFNRALGNWRLCKEHDGAVKLASLGGLNVCLYHVKDGEIVPVKVRA